MDFLSRLVKPTGTKGCARHVALAAPFVPVGVTNQDKRMLFVLVDRPPGLAFPVGKPGQQRFTNRDESIFLQQCIAGTKTIMFAVQKPLYRSIDRQMDVATTRLLNLYLVKLGYQVPTRQPQTMLLDQLTASNSRNHVVYSLLPKW